MRLHVYSLEAASVLSELCVGTAKLKKMEDSIISQETCKIKLSVLSKYRCVYLCSCELCTVYTGECVTQIVSFINYHHLLTNYDKYILLS